MTKATVCPLCESLLFRPDDRLKQEEYGSDPVDMTDALEYDERTVEASAEKGCSLCLIISRYIKFAPYLANKDCFPIIATLRHDLEGRQVIRITMTQKQETESGSSHLGYITLRPRSRSLEKPTLLLNPERDAFNRPSLTVTPVCSVSSSTSTKDPMCISTIRRWLDRCIQGHTLCGKNMSPQNIFQPPTRLIEIGAGGRARVVITEELDMEDPGLKYATLSHRWSTQPHTILLQTNIDQLCQRIDLDDLPVVFRDALVIAKQLNIRYVWIDCLCILQDSHGDWEKEASRMGEVYENAFVNLAAAAAADHEYDRDKGTEPPIGLFTARDPHYIFPAALNVARHDYSDTEFFAYTDSMVTKRNYYWRLIRRGWVFQERLLSRRSIYFGEQLTWECTESVACEAFPDGVPAEPIVNTFDEGTPRRIKAILHRENLIRAAGKGGSVSDLIYRNWRYLVQDYSRCELTFATDVLSALSGLAKSFAEVVQDEYIAGLWRKDIPSLLLWRSYWEHCREHYPSEEDYIAPSWSWASRVSVDFVMNYEDPKEFNHQFICEVIDAQVTLHGSDPMGRVSNGHITLSGLMKECHSRALDEDMHQHWPGGFADWYDSGELQGLPQLRGVTCLFVVAYHAERRNVLGLILQPTGTPNQFRRIGVFTRPYRHSDSFYEAVWYRPPTGPVKQEDYPEFADFDPDDFERQTVTII